MRILGIVFVVVAIAAMGCGGGSSNGGGSSGGQGGGSGSTFLPEREGNNCTFPEELAEHEGDEVLLCAEVAGAEYFPDQKRNTVLYVGAAAPGHSATILIEGATRSAFPEPPEERFGQPGTLVCAQGEVSLVEGVPQVFVNNQQELVFLAEAMVTGNSCTGAGTT